jgi:N-acyl amino acid synthase of PEP-CTERM/exosortase system
MAIGKSIIEACVETLQIHSFTDAYHKTFSLVEANTEALRQKAFHLRYKVFCEENGYEAPPSACAYIEHDLYDDRAVHYLLVHKLSGETAGTLRVVLPNDEKPGESFPVQLLCDHPFLKQDSRTLTLCEISRFCMARRFRKRPEDGQLLSSYSAPDIGPGKLRGMSFTRRVIPYAPAALLQGAFESALNARIMDCVWLVEPAHLPSLTKIGFTYRVLGPRVEYAGGLQPIIFNIKHVLDNMHLKNKACWDVVSDSGRLQLLADELSRNDWSDSLISDEVWEGIYNKHASLEDA